MSGGHFPYGGRSDFRKRETYTMEGQYVENPTPRSENASERYLILSDVINRCQELVELDLLIYPVPGFASIRSLGAEIGHFVSGP